MASVLPTAYFPGYTSDGTNITIPIASLGALTSAEASATTGDIREILRAIDVQVKAVYDALPINDKPTKMVVTQTNPSGVGANTVRVSYTRSYDLTLSPSTVQMAAEL